MTSFQKQGVRGGSELAHSPASKGYVFVLGERLGVSEMRGGCLGKTVQHLGASIESMTTELTNPAERVCGDTVIVESPDVCYKIFLKDDTQRQKGIDVELNAVGEIRLRFSLGSWAEGDTGKQFGSWEEAAKFAEERLAAHRAFLDLGDSSD